ILFLIFVYEVTMSSLKVVWWIYTKRSKIESEFFEVRLDVSKSWQQILIAHFITLTPGTLSIEFSDRDILLIHCLDRSSMKDTVLLVQEKLEPLLRKMEWKR